MHNARGEATIGCDQAADNRDQNNAEPTAAGDALRKVASEVCAESTQLWLAGIGAEAYSRRAFQGSRAALRCARSLAELSFALDNLRPLLSPEAVEMLDALVAEGLHVV